MAGSLFREMHQAEASKDFVLISAGRRGSGDRGSHECQHPGSESVYLCDSTDHTGVVASLFRLPRSALQASDTETADHADRRCHRRRPDPSILCGLQSRLDGLVGVSTPMFRPQGTQVQRTRHLCRSASSPTRGAASSATSSTGWSSAGLPDERPQPEPTHAQANPSGRWCWRQLSGQLVVVLPRCCDGPIIEASRIDPPGMPSSISINPILLLSK